MKNRYAFTMIELIFVIVVMGILSKFGVEFLTQAYNNFIYSSVNNTLQSQSTIAVESIAARLQFRIKDSIIARKLDNTFDALASVDSATASEYIILEWIGNDVDGFRGTTLPLWSGIIDTNPSTAIALISPETNTTALDTQIGLFANNNGANDTGINNSAIFFIGANSNINGYGWDGNPITTQNSVMHPIRKSTVAGDIDRLIPVRGDDGSDNSFAGVDVYEYYQLAWTAYAVSISDYNSTGNGTGTLKLYYDYQPWEGEEHNGTSASEATIMENVSTFRFKAIGSVVKIQVCVKSEVMEDYSLCKEKTIF